MVLYQFKKIIYTDIMFDLISIGSISIDLYFQGKSLTQTKDRFNLAVGGKYSADHFFSGLGGGGANVAIGVARHRKSVAVIGKIGNNQFKTMVLKHLAEHNISNKLCTFKDGYMKISSILLSTTSGERTIIHYETPHEHIFDEESEISKLKEAKFAYFSNLAHVSLEERNRVMSYLNKNFIPFAINLGILDCRRPGAQLEPLLEKLSVLILNTHEFSELVKIPYTKLNFKEDLRRHIPQLRDKILVVTDGEKGSTSYFDDEILHINALKAKRVVDTTGAGDAYTAGFLSGYMKDQNIPAAMQLGAKYALRIVEKLGAN
ncbi:hypothetical protein COY90_01505 [Candidatus Roizmanbacteria bacterium CG_4_10_14_0_8_um_filter_39_9]|uniref:Carbohydrate kinase PfkB domain-containing protein n=1 Tax=Candidatus Roizmanbacteria bacterium CG_4_10_14_0_8_um_filter_39_9 TaxID=1974829 RepID=A0A2M7QDI5_9BACT|nr:MAG: hypothetical protein COY90_01505 [Candidatus Roizmanbacteria bacterium CG_4_10_14_0_8_um_filter_39_9]